MIKLKVLGSSLLRMARLWGAWNHGPLGGGSVSRYGSLERIGHRSWTPRLEVGGLQAVEGIPKANMLRAAEFLALYLATSALKDFIST